MARFIAFYLPQFHPIPENDQWWGKGFTEWTNVAKAKPLFRGHKQPHIPADLGFYDLRLSEVRDEQARLATEAGIEGFCYWHYWFGEGKQILERPLREVLKSGKPDFPFCVGWANESWATKSWTAKPSYVKDRLLVEQKYSREDYITHFNSLLDIFKDKRYITVDGKPLFVVFKPLNIPDSKEFVDVWHNLAIKNGFPGIHIVGISFNISFREVGKQGNGKITVPALNKAAEYYKYLLDTGFDAVNSRGNVRAEFLITGRYFAFFKTMFRKIFKLQFIKKFDHAAINKFLYTPEDEWDNVYPTIIPNWDRSPRSGRDATIYINSTPAVFKKNVKQVLDIIKNKPEEHQIVFIQSWNEWGEGNYMEPDLEYGRGYLEALRDAVK